MSKRATIIVKGEVQRVGYRDIVENTARKLKLVGFVENRKPYAVKIVVEGEKATIDKFINEINISKSPIYVEEMETKWETPTGEFEYFEIKRGQWQEELGERMDFAGKILYEMRNDVKMLYEIKDNTNEIKYNTHTMLEKQDTMLEKQDTMLEKQDTTISEIRGMREDLKVYLDRRFERIEGEIAKIKSKIRAL